MIALASPAVPAPRLSSDSDRDPMMTVARSVITRDLRILWAVEDIKLPELLVPTDDLIAWARKTLGDKADDLNAALDLVDFHCERVRQSIKLVYIIQAALVGIATRSKSEKGYLALIQPWEMIFGPLGVST